MLKNGMIKEKKMVVNERARTLDKNLALILKEQYLNLKPLKVASTCINLPQPLSSLMNVCYGFK